MPALVVSGDGGLQQRFRLLLRPRILEGTRALTALQLQFSAKTPSSRWVLGFSVIRQQFANAFSVIWQPFGVIQLYAFLR